MCLSFIVNIVLIYTVRVWVNIRVRVRVIARVKDLRLVLCDKIPL